MIKLVIPTFKRLDKQITLNSIPDKFRDGVTLVVQPQEEKQAREIHTNLFVLGGEISESLKLEKRLLKSGGVVKTTDIGF